MTEEMLEMMEIEAYAWKLNPRTDAEYCLADRTERLVKCLRATGQQLEKERRLVLKMCWDIVDGCPRRVQDVISSYSEEAPWLKALYESDGYLWKD